MTDEYTPTTEHVFGAWARDRRVWIGAEFIQPQFERWLAGVRADAWAEGFDACANWWEIHHHGAVRDESNPHRKGATDGSA